MCDCFRITHYFTLHTIPGTDIPNKVPPAAVCAICPLSCPVYVSGGQALQQQVDLDKVEAACALLQTLKGQPRLGVLLG